MPPMTQTKDVLVRGVARVNRVEVKELVIDGRSFTKADIVSILNRIAALEAKVGP